MAQLTTTTSIKVVDGIKKTNITTEKIHSVDQIELANLSISNASFTDIIDITASPSLPRFKYIRVENLNDVDMWLSLRNDNTPDYFTFIVEAGQTFVYGNDIMDLALAGGTGAKITGISAQMDTGGTDDRCSIFLAY